MAMAGPKKQDQCPIFGVNVDIIDDPLSVLCDEWQRSVPPGYY
jgi:hypothetical protein